MRQAEWLGGLGILIGSPDDLNTAEDLYPGLNSDDFGFHLHGEFFSDVNLSELEKALQALRTHVQANQECPSNLEHMKKLSDLCYTKWTFTETFEDLEKAIEQAKMLVDISDQSHKFRHLWSPKLLGLLGQRFKVTKNIYDLDEAVRISKQESCPCEQVLGYDQSACSREQFALESIFRRDRLTWVKESISTIRDALQNAPDDRASTMERLDKLRGFLKLNGDRDGAIMVARKVLAITPLNSHKDHAERAEALGSLLHAQAKEARKIGDLHASASIMRELLDPDSVFQSHPDRNKWLSHYCHILSARFSSTGATADLEAAIDILRKEIHRRDDASNTPENLAFLGDLLGRKYHRTRQFPILEEAIQLVSRGVIRPPVGKYPNVDLGDAYYDSLYRSHEHAARLVLLAELYYEKFSVTGALRDANKGIRISGEVMASIRERDPDRKQAILVMADLYFVKFKVTGLASDLDEAIRTVTSCMRFFDEGQDRSQLLYRYSELLYERFFAFRREVDLDNAIKWACIAVKNCSDHERPMMVSALASFHETRYKLRGSDIDILNATSYYQECLHTTRSSMSFRIFAGRNLLRCYSLRKDWQAAYKVSETVISLIPKLTSRYLQNSDKQYNVQELGGLASDISAIAVQSGQAPLSALNFLEIGRGIIASYLEEMRTDVLSLRQRHPYLAEQFISLREKMNLPLSHFHASQVELDFMPASGDRATQRYEAGADFDKLVLDIRKQPGFEDFLLSPREDEYKAAAINGPIVVMNASIWRCDAIIINPDRIQLLPLPRLTFSDIGKLTKSPRPDNRQVLEWLWDVAAGPILDALGIHSPPLLNIWPRVWWVLTGQLSNFPMHAAGYHQPREGKTVLDRVISSYSPSVKALIHSRRREIKRRSSDSPAKATLIAMEHTSGCSTLPFAPKEVSVVKGQLSMTKQFEVVEPRRRKEDVLAHLANTSIFHFAGHAYTDSNDPSRSHLVLEDAWTDPLTVAALLETNINSDAPFLAYLSACGTGRVRDQRFFDESIHLIRGFQLAGFRHIIGTLWEVKDNVCLSMGRIIYEEIISGGMVDESVSKALHIAARQMRDDWLCRGSKAHRGENQRIESETNKVYTVTRNHEVAKDERDVIPEDDDEDESLPPAGWAPYVHFGV